MGRCSAADDLHISGFMSIRNPWRSKIDFLPPPHHIYTINENEV